MELSLFLAPSPLALWAKSAPRARARGYPVGTHKRSCFFLPLLRESPRFPAFPLPLPPSAPLSDDDERPPTHPCIPGIRPEQREIPPKVARELVQASST